MPSSNGWRCGARACDDERSQADLDRWRQRPRAQGRGAQRGRREPPASRRHQLVGRVRHLRRARRPPTSEAGTPSARTLLLLYAADLAFRLRWEISPALDEGRLVIAAPYVATPMALGQAAGLDPDWLADLFRFAPPASRAPRDRSGAGPANLGASRLRRICLAAPRCAPRRPDAARADGPDAPPPARPARDGRRRRPASPERLGVALARARTPRLRR